MKIAEVGDSVHLSCMSSTIVKTTTVWIQQKFGEKPVEMTSSYQNQPALFYNDFEKSGRFKTQTATGSFNLTISDLEPSDAAIYYCAGIFLSEITFGEGTVLVVKGAQLAKHTVHQQPLLDATQAGDSVTLQCTVLTESCSGEHSVYWFRHGSGEPHPRVIHTHGNRSDQCKSRSETDSSTQSCVYKLPKRNISLSDAGTYYCAVAACGQVLFGNGTKLSIQDNNPAVSTCFLALIYSNMIWLLVFISAVVLRCKNQSHSAGLQADFKMSRHISLVLILSYCAVVHLDQLRIAEVGDSVHLPCLGSKDAKTTSVWMKQNPGEKPAIIATSYQQQPGTFKNGFEMSGRFKTHKSAESFNLTITDLEPSDTAIYYCAVIFFTDITFAEGTALVVKGAPLTSYKVHQEPVLEAVRPGDSVTLQCTVLTESCSEGHSVYWFRHGSGESHPGIIYSNGNRDQCKSSSETDSSTQSCVYKLPKRNLSLSDAGTYYCAVAACGQILFGKGTKLQVGSSYTSYVVQQDQMKIAEVGDSVHLSCMSSTIVKTTTVWIQQKFGEKPVEMTSSYQNQPALFYNDFEKSGRFKTQTATGSFNLTISNVEPSDAAIYYCAGIFLSEITFGEGTVLVVKGAQLAKHKVHQQPLLDATQPGDSVTLQCTVLTESCSGEHRVYWFRHGSGEPHPRVIHTHGNRSDQCESRSETDSSTQSCVYKLPKRNLSLSDAGTYYCAVAACGQVLFGNGTKLDPKDRTFWSPAVVTLATSNIICLCVTVVLAGLLYKYHQKSKGTIDAAETTQ
ncbi:hypothetical protein NFI96_012661, partial [Prochilodus magdalenae]